MKYINAKLKQFITILLTTLFIIGCSSSGGDDDDPDPDPEPENQVPVSSAGTDQMVSRNFNVFLDGSGSSDADGDTLTFTWTQTAGTDVTSGTGSLSGETPTFAAPSDVGTLIFELVVNDGEADSPADTLIVHVLENVNVTYFVDGDNGSDDTGNGSLETPYASIAKALCEVTQEQQDIYVMTRASSAVYDETNDPCPGEPPRNADQILAIPTGTSIYGGYDGNWMRDVANNPTAVATLHHGFIFTAVNTNAWFSGFNVTADNSPDPASSAYVLSALGGDAGIFIQDNQLTAGDVAIGNANDPGSSYGLRVALMDTATIERNIITAGFGGDGLNLALVFPDRNTQGWPGSNGSGGTGGLGGGGRYPDYRNGGRGGNRSGGADGFCISPSASSGLSGQVAGLGGGAGGNGGGSCGADGSLGHAAGNGVNGNRGAGGNSSGSIDVYEDGGFFAIFLNGNGSTGNVGRSGHGGGGGGGGSESLYYNGGGGGGGGGGGSGGVGGPGGDGGGTSIGLFIASVNTVLIDDNEITSGIGGNGATGGLGQLGGLGGFGGNGVLTGNAAGNGGNGGPGGIGGNGGRGGAGGGGPSYGILFGGSIEPVISNNTITSNAGGVGGDGSTGGNGGDGGHSYAIYITPGSAVPLLTANERFFGTPGDGGASDGGTASVTGLSGVSNW